jgi:hypothetical protein
VAKANRKKKPVSLARIATGAASAPANFVDVADPLSMKPGATITVLRRLTPINDLFTRRKIDISQLAAGELFARMYAHAELGGAQAIDYTREHVDGGPGAQTLTEQQQEALDWLRRVARYHGMGDSGFRVLRAVCGDEKSVSIYARELAKRNGVRYNIALRNRAEEGYVLLRLIEALDCLVKFAEIVATGSKSRTRAEKGENLASDGGEYEIDQFGDLIARSRA